MVRKFLVRDFFNAMVIAKADVKIDSEKHNTDNLYGCGLNGFEPVVTTLESVALLIQWQCAQFNGEWDMEEMENLKIIAKRSFLIED